MLRLFLYTVLTLVCIESLIADDCITLHHPESDILVRNKYIDFAFSPDSNYLYATNSNRVFAWNVETGAFEKRIVISDRYNYDLSDIKFAKNGKWLFVDNDWGNDQMAHKIYVYDTETDQKIAELYHPHNPQPYHMYTLSYTISDDEKYLVSFLGDSVGYIVWSLDDFSKVKEIPTSYDTFGGANPEFMTNSYMIFSHPSKSEYVVFDVFAEKIIDTGEDRPNLYSFSTEYNLYLSVTGFTPPDEIYSIFKIYRYPTFELVDSFVVNDNLWIHQHTKDFSFLVAQVLDDDENAFSPPQIYNFHKNKSVKTLVFPPESKLNEYTERYELVKFSPDQKKVAVNYQDKIYIFDISDVTADVSEYQNMK